MMHEKITPELVNQINSNLLLIKDLEKQYKAGILSNKFIDEIIDNITTNTMYIIDSNMPDELIVAFDKILDDFYYFDNGHLRYLNEYYNKTYK